MSSIVISGDTSGSVTLQAPAIAGSTVVTLPTTSMNMGTGGGSVATNTAFGASALAANTTGANNVAIGYEAGKANTTGVSLVAMGRNAALNNTTGNDITAIGRDALYSNTTGASNTALGSGALLSNTTASNSTAVGYQAGYSTTTAGRNTLVGQIAGYALTTGGANVVVGDNAFKVATTAENSVAIGTYALAGTTTGNFNTAIGAGAGEAITTGSKNTIIGRYTGSTAPISATGSNYIVFSDGDANVKGWFGAGNSNDLFRVGTTSTATPEWMHQISYSQVSRYVLGVTNDVSSGGPNGLIIKYPNVAAAASTDYFLLCSNSTTTRAIIKNDGGLSNFSANNVNLSDRREKEDFNPAGEYLSKICAIPVQTFRYIDRDAEDTAFTLGVVAQDVQTVAPELVAESDWSSEEDGSKMRLSIYQTDLQYALMKCIQEQQSLITTLTTRITALEAKVGA